LKAMARERKKQTDDFDIFAAAATDSKRRRVAAPAAPSRAGGPSGPAMSGGPSGPAMRGKGATAPAKRRRRSADDKDLQALYGN
jgi:hypothetical protein